MAGFDRLDILFVASAFGYQILLITHFAVRRWSFDIARKYGWIVYVLGIPAAAASLVLLQGGRNWSLWLGGFLYLTWGIFGFVVEYVLEITWRNPIRWPIFGPYVALYLATTMFYWWPLGLISSPLWVLYTILFTASTVLNVTSHRRPGDQRLSV